MELKDVIAQQKDAETMITQLYSQAEDLKQRLANTNIELERFRGEYRAYGKIVEQIRSFVPAEEVPEAANKKAK